MTLNLKKCKIFTSCIDYLRHVICSGNHNESKRTVDIICRLEQPTHLTAPLSFPGLCDVLHQFEQNIDCITAQLDLNLGNGQPSAFDRQYPDKITTAETLKPKLAQTTVLLLPNLWDYYTIDKGTCNKFIDCVLPQKQPDWTDWVIQYWPRSIKHSERAYDMTQCVCFAKLWAALLLHF